MRIPGTSEVERLVRRFVVTVYRHVIQCFLNDLNIVSAGCGVIWAGITYE